MRRRVWEANRLVHVYSVSYFEDNIDGNLEFIELINITTFETFIASMVNSL